MLMQKPVVQNQYVRPPALLAPLKIQSLVQGQRKKQERWELSVLKNA